MSNFSGKTFAGSVDGPATDPDPDHRDATSKMLPGVSTRRLQTALRTVTVPPSVGAR